MKMDKQESFRVLLETAKDAYKLYVQNVMGTLGVLLLAIGWMVTSKESRNFLGDTDSIRILSIVVIVFLAFAHTAVCLFAYRVAAKKFVQLQDLDYADVEYFESYKLPKWMVGVNLIMNLFFFAILLCLVWVNAKCQ